MSWYTIQEAVDKTGLPRSVVERKIMLSSIEAKLFCRKLSVMAFSYSEDGHIVGHGHFEYFGPITVEDDFIREVMQREGVKIGKRNFDILDAHGVDRWYAAQPFTTLPIGDLISWEERAFDRTDLNATRYRYLPKAKKSLRAQLRTQLGALPESEISSLLSMVVEKLDEPNAGEWLLDFDSSQVFEISDVVISTAQIERLLIQEGEKAEKTVQATSQIPPMGRIDLLAEVLWRVISDRPDISAKECLSLLKSDSDAEVPVYDVESIIVSAEGLGILWTDQNHKDRSLSLKALANRLSKLRALYQGS